MALPVFACTIRLLKELPMHARTFDPIAQDLRSFSWRGGSFDTGQRPYTERVEGFMRTPNHVLLLTLRGGAEHIEVSTDCGHTYAGPDRPGAVSLVPAHCERRTRMRGVDAEWASIAVAPGPGEGEVLAPFTNVEDPFVAALVGELTRLIHADGRLEPLTCEAMGHAARRYLIGRYSDRANTPARPWKLAPWRLKRLSDYVEANLDRDILIGDLAAAVGLSVGHLHRAFRVTTGTTPLEFIHRLRIKRAAAILASEQVPVADLALRVGFQSPSHFARTFRRFTGVNPSRYGRG
jgi:AraC family transcriptional regulator